MLELNVDLGERSYPIYIEEGLLGNSDCLNPWIIGKQVAVVTNETIAPVYLDRVIEGLSGYDVIQVVLPDGEQYKTVSTTERIFDDLLKASFTRKATIIALGGGVVGDMAGFAAACYQRGIHFIQVPTTLLSQVDSSVGGKTGVNHPLGKNMIGAFHQPQAVIIDTQTLNTLPDRELSAGIAEVIKYGLICDRPFYDWLHDNIGALKQRELATLAYAIERSCSNKAKVVAEDEKEAGVRAILNLGHTFGHAIETTMGYGQWLHGEAVAAGMVMAADLSARLGMISREDVDGVITILKRAELPVKPPQGMTPEQFLECMVVDKKVIDGQLRLVLLQSVGSAIVTDRFDHTCLKDCLESLCRV